MLSTEGQELPLERLLDLVRANLWRRYRTHSEREDLVQEAVIYAWRKHADGATDYESYIAGRNRARNLVYSLKTGTGDTYLGKPVNTAARRQQSNGDASREKIRNYVQDYSKLHGEQPNPTKISKALGISRNTIRHHLERLHMFDGAPETRPGTLSLDAPMSESTDATWEQLLPAIPAPDDEILVRIDVSKAVSGLDDRDKHYLYKEFWEDKTYAQIAKELNVGGAYVNKLRKQVLGRMKETLEPVH